MVDVVVKVVCVWYYYTGGILVNILLTALPSQNKHDMFVLRLIKTDGSSQNGAPSGFLKMAKQN